MAEKVCLGTPSQSAHVPYSRVSFTSVSPTSNTTDSIMRTAYGLPSGRSEPEPTTRRPPRYLRGRDEKGSILWRLACNAVKFSASGPTGRAWAWPADRAFAVVSVGRVRRFAGVPVWFGRSTLQWWAMLRPARGRRLLAARSARELAEVLDRALGRFAAGVAGGRQPRGGAGQ